MRRKALPWLPQAINSTLSLLRFTRSAAPWATVPIRQGVSVTMTSQAESDTASTALPGWWQNGGARRDAEGGLWLGGYAAQALAAEYGTPSYVYLGERIEDNVRRLRQALNAIGCRTRLYYAVKSNRHPAVLRQLHALGVGLDVCSPGEVRHALGLGYTLGDLSFTAGCLSRADYQALAEWREMWVNADSLTALRRIAELSPGRELGLRINPASGLGYGDNDMVRYAGRKPSKFGVYLDRFAEALALASSRGLRLTGLHCHAGCGFLTPQFKQLEQVFARIGEFLDRAPGIRRLNLGGGLGIPLVPGDPSLDLEAWAGLVRHHFCHRGLELCFEPGDYLVKDAGALLCEVTQVEEKGGTVFVGLDAGFNVHPEPAFYKLPCWPAPAQWREGAAQRVTLAGNINEALDLFLEDVALPPLAEGDVLCLLNAGGYGASMASQHCLRNEYREHWLERRTAPDVAQLNQANKAAWDQLYARTDALVWGSEPMPFLNAFAADMAKALREPSRVLDAGTGEGRNLPFLLQLGASETHAADASPHGIAKIASELRERVSLKLCDLAYTGYPDAHFDAITLLDVYETLPDAEAVLGELARVLKPGGVLLCNIPGFDDGVAGHDMAALGADAFLYQQAYYFRFVDAEAAEARLRQAGLEVLRSEHHAWREAPHPGFRDEEHTHVSHVLLARRPDSTA